MCSQNIPKVEDAGVEKYLSLKLLQHKLVPFNFKYF